jgi:hypothetical protein
MSVELFEDTGFYGLCVTLENMTYFPDLTYSLSFRELYV